MTDTNSPTNLTADLESSVERTNTTTNSNEIQPELASAIRSDESNSYSPIMEHYNSPTAPLTADTDDATARLLRIRDELTQQVRERDNAARQLEIQKEIDELQNSLDRRKKALLFRFDSGINLFRCLFCIRCLFSKFEFNSNLIRT